jgi:hypothetical protein
VAEGYVIRQQCYFKTADPLFFEADELQQPNWNFAGRLDATDYFEALEADYYPAHACPEPAH